MAISTCSGIFYPSSFSAITTRRIWLVLSYVWCSPKYVCRVPCSPLTSILLVCRDIEPSP
jgi:hypothetical protein